MRKRHRSGWIRPLRRMRRATEACLRWIDCSCVLIDTMSRFAAQRPVYTTIQLQRVWRWLDAAAGYLRRAGFCLRDTEQSLMLAPEEEGGAPARIFDATLQWLIATARLLETQERLVLLMAEVTRIAKEGVVDPRPAIAAPHPAAHWYLRYCPPQPSDCILLLLQRRRRPVRTASADAPRRVSRGRAPPFVSTCPL